VIAGVQDVTFTLKTGRDGDDDTYSACLLDVGYQLKHHLLNPPANSPPLIDPRTSHVFPGAESNVDNFANSPAGKEYNVYLQKLWVQRDESGGWASKLRRNVEAKFPDRVLHFIPILAGLFGDGLAISEGLHASLFQLRIKLGTFHPALAFLPSLCLLAGLCEKPVLGDKARAETTVNFNDLHSEIWAKLGFSHFFDDQFVALPWEDVAHLGVPGKAGEVVVFKLCLFGLMLDNGEARAMFGTQNCLICTGIGPSSPGVPAPASAACARCAFLHASRPAALPPGYVLDSSSGAQSNTVVVRALDARAGVYEVAVRQTVPQCTITAGAGNRVVGKIDGSELTVTAVLEGVLGVGSTVVGDGVVAHTVVTGMAAGANGGPGTYTVNVPQDVLECPLLAAKRGRRSRNRGYGRRRAQGGDAESGIRGRGRQGRYGHQPSAVSVLARGVQDAAAPPLPPAFHPHAERQRVRKGGWL
jgi:hypothetical protein